MTSSTRYGDVYPSLFYDDAPKAIDWLCRAFGFEQRLVVRGAHDRVEHSELTLGRAVIMVASPLAEMRRFSPRTLGGVNQALSLHVDDPDAHHRQAKLAGAEIVRELRDEDYGSRGYMAQDPEGHIWYFGTYRPGANWGKKARGEPAA